MLTALTIKNYALIDDLQIGFNNGLSIITGETGAGKSIVLGALSLILGKRADLSSIRNSDKKCIVEATFDVANYNLKKLFKQNDLDYETETIIRREILPSGKSRAFVNDSPVNLSALQVLGDTLLDVHSQHETLQLLKQDFQFLVIDALANNKAEILKYTEALKQYKSLKKELQELQTNQAEFIKELDYNAFLLNELEEIRLETLNLQELETTYEELDNIETIQEKLSQVHQILSEEQVGVLTTLKEAANALEDLSKLSSKYNELYNRVNSSYIELDDVFSDVETTQGEIDANPELLDEVNGKLSQLHNLFQKHSVASVEELQVIESDLAEKVSVTQNIDSAIQQKEAAIKYSEEKLQEFAKAIHKKREAILPKLKTQLENLLSNLGMPNARFKIEATQGDTYFTNGTDSLSFLFSANKGSDFNELKKVASGGELSRIMLSVKYILAQYIKLPTIMFDEIDTGVSGEVATQIASMMKDMSKHMQVFAITHSPQIAAKGETHYKVYKEDVNELTRTNLIKLKADDRIVEIAQMLGGTEVSSSAMAHAKELLN